MIRSYASDLAREIYQANWDRVSSPDHFEQIDECSWDLRFLDCAATTDDLLRIFRGRIEHPVMSGVRNSLYAVKQAPQCSFPYQIMFSWADGHVHEVDVVLAPIQDRFGNDERLTSDPNVKGT